MPIFQRKVQELLRVSPDPSSKSEGAGDKTTSDCKKYVQETGRGGRDGDITYCILYFSKTDTSFQFMEQDMKSYCKNTQLCRRELLFREFDDCCKDKPNCCLCCGAVVCSCVKCKF